MATPVKSIQFRNIDDLLECYAGTEVPAFAIKMGKGVCFKYEGDSLEDGKQQLGALLDLIQRNESAGIYTLCIYESIPGEHITDKTEAGYSWNFRLNDYGSSNNAQALGPMLQFMEEVKNLRKEVRELKEAKQEEPENKLGMIGDIMDIPAVQPIMMALAGKIGDWISGGTVGQLKRVSGVPGGPADHYAWLQNEAFLSTIDRLYKGTDDFPALLEKLADMQEKTPGKYKMYIGMFSKMR